MDFRRKVTIVVSYSTGGNWLCPIQQNLLFQDNVETFVDSECVAALDLAFTLPNPDELPSLCQILTLDYLL